MGFDRDVGWLEGDGTKVLVYSAGLHFTDVQLMIPYSEVIGSCIDEDDCLTISLTGGVYVADEKVADRHKDE